jgi:L-alanine-DL-glutamate epimerase-like enolase superfamily enzyme
VAATRAEATVERLEVAVYTVPTEEPESDGTMEWDATTVTVVRACGGGRRGLGYTYGSAAAGSVVGDLLAPLVVGRDVLDVRASWKTMVAAVRNIGRPGVAAGAISAVDIALWDLKARVLDLPLVTILDQVHDAVPIYGSGGFTSYSVAKLTEQLVGWAADGIPRVKMKVGRDPAADLERVLSAVDAVGPAVEVMVDANGAYAPRQALEFAEHYADLGVGWFEEPVSSDDLDGLRLLRSQAPGGLRIAAGEYGYDPWYYRGLVDAVDVVQADVTRCGGITGLLEVAGFCDVHHRPLSTHTAPQASAHAAAACLPLLHLEYFHDHVRVERLLFDGVLTPEDGRLVPDDGRIGTGLELKEADAAPFQAGKL